MIRVRPSQILLSALCLGAAFPTAKAAEQPAAAPQSPSPEAKFEDWSLYTFEEDGKPVCYIASRIQRSSESVARRKTSFILITNRPAEGRKGVVSIAAGYTYQEGSPVTLTIGRNRFRLFTDVDTAWANDSDDPKILAAVKSGKTAAISGQVKGGPTAIDTFSLRGSSAALGALDRACPMPTPPRAAAKPRAATPQKSAPAKSAPARRARKP